MKRDLDVVYVDNHLLVVIKPPGLLAQADRTGDADVLNLGKCYLKARYDKPGNVFLGLAHRLDRPASGLMVLARTSKAAARLTDQFKRRTVRKRYVALVEGELQGAGLQTDYLLKERGHVRAVPQGTPGAKRAELQWRSIGTKDGLTLIEVQLKTGRAHQVRVQLASLGHAILGDFRYGARRELDGRNLALHAYHLALMHPTQRERVGWSAPPPDVWPGHFDNEVQSLIEEAERFL